MAIESIVINMKPPPIFILTGTPGSGKTSVSKALLKQYKFGIHIPVDDLREWVVSGIAHPVPVWTEETGRQFQVAREAAAQVAKRYAEAAFSVAIDDVISPPEVEEIFDYALPSEQLYKVLLRPSLEITLHRNKSRTNKEFDTEVLHDVICKLYQNQRPSDYLERNWLVLDSSDEDVSMTVSRIMRHFELSTTT